MYGQTNKVNKPVETNKNELFKQIYKSAIKASYFNGFQDPNFVKKSKIQRQEIQQEEQKQIDEKTFRMMKGFKRPDESFKVYSKKGNVTLQSSGFLCFNKTKIYQAELYNTKFSIREGDLTVRYADFNAVSAQVLQKGNKIYITFEGLPNKENAIKFEPVDKHGDEHKAWTQILYKSIKESDGLQKHYNFLSNKCPDFYKYQHVLNSEFQAKANTGDIILFRSTHNAARAQQTLLNSQYDHVGILLRNSKNQLYIFESTSGEGVGMTPWRYMTKYQWYKQIDKICWRPLNIQLADYEVQVIEAFVAKTLGKQYEINLNKLFQFTSKLERTKQDDEKKTYFCSELVARLYKELKIIDSDKASTLYYPVDFSQKGNLKFVRPGTKLGNQTIIAFEKP